AGSITIIATGTDLEYSIDAGTNFQTSNVFTGLAAGEYNIVVMDGSGATVGTTVTLVAPEIPVIDDISTEAPDCGLSNGSLSIAATGTDLQYSTDGGGNFQPSPVFADLAAGTYEVVVVNDAGCTANATVTLEASNAPEIDGVDVTLPL